MKLSRPLLSLALFPLLLTSAQARYVPYDMDMDDDVEKAISQALFTKMDADNDNKISFDEVFVFRQEEIKKREEARVNTEMAQCDKNNDGKLGKDELLDIDFSDPNIQPPAEGSCFIPVDALEIMDLNGDGFITRKELTDSTNRHRKPPKKFLEKEKQRQKERMKKQAQEQFTRCDKDKDDFLTLREAAAMQCGMFTELFDGKDKNGDELISLEEMQQEVPPEVVGIPASPSEEEMEADMPPEVRLEMKISRCDKNENGRLELDETNAKNCMIEISEFNQLDHNNDGAIDYQETRRLQMKTGFDELDKNHDGYLDKKEFKGSRVRYL